MKKFKPVAITPPATWSGRDRYATVPDLIGHLEEQGLRDGPDFTTSDSEKTLNCLNWKTLRIAAEWLENLEW